MSSLHDDWWSDAYEIVSHLRDWLDEADHYFEVFSPIDRYDDGNIRATLELALRDLLRSR